MQGLLDAIISFSNWIWGIPMLVIIVGGSIYLTIKLGFMQFRYFGYAMSQTFGKLFTKKDKAVEGEGTLTAWQAASAALASAIGASNIVGVPVAVAFGGPGAIFWMWLVAFVGAGAKVAEIALGVKYRELNEEGEYVGGPMYYLPKGIKGPLGKILGVLFSFFLMVELVPSIATQAVSVVQTATTMGIPNWASGLVLMILVGAVVFGGIKRIGRTTEKLVPFMAILYVIGAIVIIIVNIGELPRAIGMIFRHAFTPMAAVGGFTGSTIASAMRWGTARGVYSNESGMGTAPIAHATATTDHPIRQSLWGVFENVVDTLVVCTATGLIVVITGLYLDIPASEAATMPSFAFQTLLGPGLGSFIVTLSITLFVLSTVIVIVFYGEKQAESLFGLKFAKVMRVIYVLAIMMGAFGTIQFLYQFLDIMLALIIIPNMIGLVILSDEVKDLYQEFFSNPEYYEKAKAKKIEE